MVRVGRSIETSHLFGLVHPSTRRSAPTLHRALSQRHTVYRPAGLACRVGASAAALLGDLAPAWSYELLNTAGLTSGQLAAVLKLAGLPREEVLYERHRDMTRAGRSVPNGERALRIARFKTAARTVERPLVRGPCGNRRALPSLNTAEDAYASARTAIAPSKDT